jgi:capsular polysaccharide biosynthesis protein
MKDFFEKMLSTLDKQYLVIAVLTLAGFLLKFGFSTVKENQNEIINGQAELRLFVIEQAKKSNTNDSIQNLKMDELKGSQYLMRVQMDTMIHHQTPELMKTLKMMEVFSNTYSNRVRNSPIIEMQVQPIASRIETDEAMILLDKIETTMLISPPDSIKKNESWKIN